MASAGQPWPHGGAISVTPTRTPSPPKKQKTSKDAPATTTSRDSSFPVELPKDAALWVSGDEFAAYVHQLVEAKKASAFDAKQSQLFESLDIQSLDDFSDSDTDTGTDPLHAAQSARQKQYAHYLQQALSQPRTTRVMPAGRAFTANGAIGFATTNSALLDLFTELEKTIDGPRLVELLDTAWAEDPLITLRIIWNARSIHLGKGEHGSFYRSVGWLWEHHPKTLLVNLAQLCRRIIPKTSRVEAEAEPDAVIVVGPSDEPGPATPEIRNGASHGYWKDLLSILVLAVHDRLQPLDDPRAVLHKPNLQPSKRLRTASTESFAPADPTAARHALEHARHVAVRAKFAQDPAYRALHLSVARLFATQLRKDKALLEAGDTQERAHISLAAKWAPSLEKFHDKHTLVASTIAELLFPAATLPARPPRRQGESSRTAYVRVARERYRAEVLAPLRAHLGIVERAISANAIHRIDYSAVPSVAMHKYKHLFADKDFSRFAAHVDAALAGTRGKRIAGAVLQPAALVAEARKMPLLVHYRGEDTLSEDAPPTKAARRAALARRKKSLAPRTLDAQWKSLVERMRAAGALDSLIAVCDVSGSMKAPFFQDGTVPLDTAIGVALLIAEVAAPPFGGGFVTFSGQPSIVRVGGPADKRSFVEKVHAMASAEWGRSTNLERCFRLLLDVALRHDVKPGDFVKNVVVISDMQFDANQRLERPDPWESTHERLVRVYADEGYRLPRLVYWNLNAHVGAKPVQKDTEHSLLVSGYSQGLLRAFMEQGGFDCDALVPDEEEDAEEVTVDKNGTVSVEVPRKKRKTNPMAGLQRAVEHPAYAGLVVID